MKKMISASIALSVMEEPQVGPTVVTLTLSGATAGTLLAGDVVVVVGAAAAPALAVVVVDALAVVVVVACACACVSSDFGACASATSTSAFWTFLLTACCWSWL